uniref:Transposase Tc1-like domain-containing protein n=1 Tax=Pundamilia nyererei TaxID=303518 RepID=A0A3B4GVI0_9CICH
MKAKVMVSVSTISCTIKMQSETGDNSDRKRSGRPKAMTESKVKFLSINSFRDWQLTGQQLQAQLNSGRSKQPLLIYQNKTKRLRCKVLWTDESKSEIFGSSRRILVRRRGSKRMVPQCVASTVKPGGGSMMVWGCFAGSRAGDWYRVRGTLNQNGYQSILQCHAIPSAMHLVGQGFNLQQDNDPKTSDLLASTVSRFKPHQAEYLTSIVERMPRMCSAGISAKGSQLTTICTHFNI